MKCKVVLNNGKAGGLFTTKGELNKGENGFGLFYSIDGDKCFLRYSDGELLQERRGSAPMLMRFKVGEETNCKLGIGRSSGSFPLFTDKMEVSCDDNSAEIMINYTCLGENVTLNITAKA